MNLARKLKINKITEVFFSDLEKDILVFIDTNLRELETYETFLYNEYTFFLKKEGVCVIALKKHKYRIEGETDCLLVRADILYRVLVTYYFMNEKDAEAIIKWKVSLLLNENINIINHKWISTHISTVENIFKREKALFN